MKDIIKTPEDLGQVIRDTRKGANLKATAIAERSGRARNVLYRLEGGQDITVASLFDILRAMKLALRLEPLGIPTLEEMRRQFDEADDAMPDPAITKKGR
jgi:transcriptional regulator with XRE-family HTH domain